MIPSREQRNCWWNQHTEADHLTTWSFNSVTFNKAQTHRQKVQTRMSSQKVTWISYIKTSNWIQNSRNRQLHLKTPTLESGKRYEIKLRHDSDWRKSNGRSIRRRTIIYTSVSWKRLQLFNFDRNAGLKRRKSDVILTNRTHGWGELDDL